MSRLILPSKSSLLEEGFAGHRNAARVQCTINGCLLGLLPSRTATGESLGLEMDGEGCMRMRSSTQSKATTTCNPQMPFLMANDALFKDF